MTGQTFTPDQAVAALSTDSSPYALTTETIRGTEYRVFKHALTNLGQVYALSTMHDGKTLLVYEDERYDVSEVRQRAHNLAHHLVHDLGIKKGDRVALAMRNYPEWCFTYMAATMVGAVIVPLNAWWTGPELRYGLDDSGAKVLVVDPERLDRVSTELTGLPLQVIVARAEGEPPKGVLRLESLLQGTHAAPACEVAPDDDATIMYTSGSTGSPKGVVSTHRAVVSALMAWEFMLFSRLLTMPEAPPQLIELVLAWLKKGPEALQSRPLQLPQRSMLITVPLFHVTGCNVQFLPAFRSGRKLVMMHKWNPERALELIERERVTDFNGVPTMSWELVNSPDFEKRDTSSLMSLSAGGASRPPEHVKQLRKRAKNALPSTGYGMTETNSVGAAIGGEEYVMRPASVGQATRPLVDLKIVDDEDRTLTTDQEGQICIKSVTNMRAYWNRPDESGETLRNGWVYTGDLGRIDAEGFLFITGRAKDIVIRGGENISCPEVEHALYEHPAVLEAGVYGVPDARLGEALAASVRLKPETEVSPDDLRAHVASRLALFKVPAHLWLQRHELPRLASTKLDKRALREAAVDRLGLRGRAT
ncbi:MAG: class I adenylate-forming enzyme family protein [Myxococcales bacterium]|nr:class I adenylate-forming enzyme family protein [Myxococcales bacterium]